MEKTVLTVDGCTYAYRNESTQKPPKRVQAVREASAAAVLAAAHANTATWWQGDFHNAKQVLAAMKKKLRKPLKPQSDAANAFHQYRLAQSQQSRTLNMLLVWVNADFTLDLPRAPDAAAALRDVYGADGGQGFLLPLNQLLGFIGAHEWHKKGVDVPQAGGRVHVPFGVFSPLRGEYLDLAAAAPLAEQVHTAWDIGTGSGVLAAVLARRGVAQIVATDTNPRALACAQRNLQGLGLDGCVSLLAQDLFPEGRADLIVCNPPWLPAKPTSAVETALYDPDSAMLKAFLQGVAARLNAGGEAWLIMSDFAEHLGLRAPNELADWIAASGLRIVDCLHTAPQHGKAQDSRDALAFARSRERTTLYRLQPVA